MNRHSQQIRIKSKLLESNKVEYTFKKNERKNSIKLSLCLYLEMKNFSFQILIRAWLDCILDCIPHGTKVSKKRLNILCYILNRKYRYTLEKDSLDWLNK